MDAWGQLEPGLDIEKHLAGRTFHAELEDGTWLAMDGSRFARFAEAFLEAQGLDGFHRAEAGRLFELAEALEGCGAPWTGDRALLGLGAHLKSLADAPAVAAPAALRGELRPYQRAGFGWLRALSECGFGAVLADDMGLGKTVQALALLVHRHLNEHTDRPSLLVVSTSLIGNWRREAARFARTCGCSFCTVPAACVVLTISPTMIWSSPPIRWSRAITGRCSVTSTIRSCSTRRRR